MDEMAKPNGMACAKQKQTHFIKERF